RKTPLREPPPPDQLLRDSHRVLRRRREMRTLRISFCDSLADGRVGMPLDHGAEPVVEVPHAVTVHIPDKRTLAPFEVDRPRLLELVRRRHPTGQHPVRQLIHFRRSTGALNKPILLAPDHFPQTPATKLAHGLTSSQGASTCISPPFTI